MAKIKRRRITLDNEKSIFTNLITSDYFCKEVIPITDHDYFKTKPTQILIKWIIDYYKKYKQAPKQDIQEIYFSKTENLDDNDTEIIHNILSNLSDYYEEPANNNLDFIVKQATDYYRRRAVEVTRDRLDKLVSNGKIDKAEEVIKDFKKVTKQLAPGIYFEPKGKTLEILESKFDKEKSNPFDILTLYGRLGEFLGPLRRRWLVGILGGFKKGKSFLLNEFILAAVTSKLNVVFVTLEMSEEAVISRLLDRVTAIPDGKKGKYLFPVFDCGYNQDGSCMKKERKCDGVLTVTDDKGKARKPKYDEFKNWVPCTECRGSNSFSIVTWFEPIKKKDQTYKKAKSKLQAFTRMFGKRLRIISFPRNSVSLDEIEKVIDDLIYSDNFVPDVIAIDYLDITLAEDRKLTGIPKSDEVWKAGSSLSARKNCLVITPIQANKKSRKKRWIEGEDVADDQHKLQHAEVAFGINQFDVEKKEGVIRINIVIHRFKEYIEQQGVTVLQNLKFGQTHLDSEY